jgi:AAA family ATP:ADP antiporter
MSQAPIAPAARPSFRDYPIEYVLRLFADVREGEGPTALLLTVNVFLLLTAYYFLKVAREPLILLGGGAEVKSYAAVGQSILLVFVTSGYSWLASRVGRMALITWVTVIFIVNLVVFWALGERGVPLGVPFFLWVGIFNMTAVAQFWSFAADIYPEEQGKRLFPIVGIGSSVGAVAGAWIADEMFRFGPFKLMLMSAFVLVLTLGLTYVTNEREKKRERPASPGAAHDTAPPSHANGFSLVMRDRYLLLFAGLMFFLNWVTKTGDYVLDRRLIDAAHASGFVGHDATVFIGQFKARYFEWSNGIGVVLQLFVVSRIVKYFGLRVAMVVMPIASLAGYGSALAVPVIGVLFAARAFESSLDYSLFNTTRHALWLVTPRDAKYKAKQVIDTFVVRVGDAASAGLVWYGARTALSLSSFIVVNLVLTTAWLAFAIMLGRSYATRTASSSIV